MSRNLGTEKTWKDTSGGGEEIPPVKFVCAQCDSLVWTVMCSSSSDTRKKHRGLNLSQYSRFSVSPGSSLTSTLHCQEPTRTIESNSWLHTGSPKIQVMYLRVMSKWSFSSQMILWLVEDNPDRVWGCDIMFYTKSDHCFARGIAGWKRWQSLWVETKLCPSVSQLMSPSSRMTDRMQVTNTSTGTQTHHLKHQQAQPNHTNLCSQNQVQGAPGCAPIPVSVPCPQTLWEQSLWLSGHPWWKSVARFTSRSSVQDGRNYDSHHP